jgi:hypothetical protein
VQAKDARVKDHGRCSVRKVLIACLCVAPVVVLIVAGAFQARSGNNSRGMDMALSGADTPIPGTEVSDSEALSSAPNGLPTLAGMHISDVCDGTPDSLQELSVWMSPSDVPADAQQFGMTYSNGIWLAIDSVKGYSQTIQNAVDKTGDLPSLEVAMPDEKGGSLTDGYVRGHVAWEKELTKGFSCANTSYRAVGSDADASATPTAEAQASPPVASGLGVIFDPTTTASIRWAENGYVILLSGPYPLSVLEKVADDIQWEK